MKDSYCENCDKWLTDPNNENAIIGKCPDCGKKAYHSSFSYFCSFCSKEVNKNKEE
jgi:DNA-directed RNA polymerase subunit RPC12/RpoP